jgi:hypothetical protein
MGGGGGGGFVGSIIDTVVDVVEDVVDFAGDVVDSVVETVSENPVLAIAAIATAAYTGGASLGALESAEAIGGGMASFGEQAAINAALAESAAASAGTAAGAGAAGSTLTIDEAIELAKEFGMPPEGLPPEFFPDFTPPGGLPPLELPTIPELPATPEMPAIPESAPSAPNLIPDSVPQAESLLPGEVSGVPKGTMKPGLSYLANALGAPVEMVEALQNPIVSNMVTSIMRSGLTGKSLEDAIENALLSGASAGITQVGTDLTGSKLAGRLASYATTSAIRGQSPSIEGFLGTAAAQGVLNAASTDLPDWAKPGAELATNYISGQVGQALTDTPTPKQGAPRQTAPMQPTRLTAGTPTGLPTASTGTLGTPTGGGLPVGMIEKVSPTDQYSAGQFGQILGAEDPLTNTPLRYGNQFARPQLQQTGLSSTMPTDSQLPSLYAGLTPEQASLFSASLMDQDTALDPALQKVLLGRGYAVGGVVDMVPGPEDRLYRRHMKRGFAVNGPGTGQSDDIPTMLADGEYVIDADTVAQLGDGSSKAGAQILDKFREEIRQHKRSAPVNKIPPAAKSPLEYLKMARKKHG